MQTQTLFCIWVKEKRPPNRGYIATNSVLSLSEGVCGMAYQPKSGSQCQCWGWSNAGKLFIMRIWVFHPMQWDWSRRDQDLCGQPRRAPYILWSLLISISRGFSQRVFSTGQWLIFLATGSRMETRYCPCPASTSDAFEPFSSHLQPCSQVMEYVPPFHFKLNEDGSLIKDQAESASPMLVLVFKQVTSKICQEKGKDHSFCRRAGSGRRKPMRVAILRLWRECSTTGSWRTSTTWK